MANMLTDAWDSLSKSFDSGVEGAKGSLSTGVKSWFNDAANNFFHTKSGEQTKKDAIGMFLANNLNIIIGVIAFIVILALVTRKKW